MRALAASLRLEPTNPFSVLGLAILLPGGFLLLLVGLLFVIIGLVQGMAKEPRDAVGKGEAGPARIPPSLAV